jgi:hypothetical protein
VFKYLKPIVTVLVLTSMLFSLVPVFDENKTIAAPTAGPGEVLVGPIDNPPEMFIADAVPGPDKFISGNAALEYGTIQVNVPDTTSVVVKNEAGTVVASLTDLGGGMWRVPTINGTAMVAKNTDLITLPKSYFEWFRDPNKLVWMYDLDDGRYFRSTRPSISGIPPDSCIYATGVSAADEYGGTVSGCNNIKMYRGGTLDVNTLSLPMDDGTFYTAPINYMEALHFSAIRFLANGKIRVADATTEIGFSRVDPNTMGYDFAFTSTFDMSPDTMTSSVNGIVATYNNEWEVDLEATVYSYPRLTAFALTTPCDPAVCNPPVPPIQSGGGCTAPALQSTTGPQTFMDPQATGVIKADARGSEKFNVVQGIPTDENLYANVLAKSYLHKYQFDQMNGTCTYQINVTRSYSRKWQDRVKTGSTANGTPIYKCLDRSDIQVRTIQYDVTRPYSYWQVQNLEVFKLVKSILNNYALPPAGSTTLNAVGYTPPVATYAKPPKHLYEPSHNNLTLSTTNLTAGCNVGPPPVPVENWSSNAQGQVGRVQVQNDSVTFNGNTIMDNVKVDDVATTPGSIPASGMITSDILYKSALTIKKTLLNKGNNLSTGTIDYSSVLAVGGAGGTKTYPVNAINSITVHTPVVNYSKMPDDNRPFDQSMNPDMARTVLVLGRPFPVNFNESGDHRSILGYGNNNYKKYTEEKRVQLPFDVYETTNFYPAGTWIDYPVGTHSMVFDLPTWVEEGTYTVRTESWATNAPSRDSALCERNMNGNLNNYCSFETFEVKVVGRLYDFMIYDIGDLRYEEVFRPTKGSTAHTGNAYYSGGRDKDRQDTSFINQRNWLLPIRPGSKPEEVATTPHNGYPFSYAFKTVGNMFLDNDVVQATPTFWFVDKNGGSAQQVDLYYDTSGNSNKFIKVGSAQDQALFKRNNIQMGDPLRNIAASELDYAAGYEYDNILTGAERSATTRAKFIEQYKKVKVGTSIGYSATFLKYGQRTLIGPNPIPGAIPPSVDQDRAKASIQRWYGDYNLPIAPYILPINSNLEGIARSYGGKIDGNEPEFLKHGYITVNLDLKTIQRTTPTLFTLGYISPNANMWEIEGQVASSTSYLGKTFNYNYGDVIMFESDFSVRNDFQGTGR